MTIHLRLRTGVRALPATFINLAQWIVCFSLKWLHTFTPALWEWYDSRWTFPLAASRVFLASIWSLYSAFRPVSSQFCFCLNLQRFGTSWSAAQFCKLSRRQPQAPSECRVPCEIRKERNLHKFSLCPEYRWSRACDCAQGRYLRYFHGALEPLVWLFLPLLLQVSSVVSLQGGSMQSFLESSQKIFSIKFPRCKI